jgi:hypothetical protein
VASRKPGAEAVMHATRPSSARRRLQWALCGWSARNDQVARAVRRALVRWGMRDLPDYPGDFFVR